MATSRNTEHGTAGVFSRVALDRVSSLSRYDLVLAAIPLVFAVGLTVHALGVLSLQLAVSVGAVTSTLLLVDAIYLNPPVDSGFGGPPR